MKNKLETINDFFTMNIQDNPEEIFNVLKNIIQFKSGFIFFSNPKRLIYSTKDTEHYQNKINENLNIKNSNFGSITIERDEIFTIEEKKLFKTCSLIIASLIKDIEISKIIAMQIKALEEGICEKDEAYKSEKIKNDFFSNFSHELRTPLNSIISSSELLSEKIFGTLNDKQSEYVNDIQIAGLHLLGMINDILDMSKIESNSIKLNPREFELEQAIDEVLNIVKPIAEKKSIRIVKKIFPNTIINADYQKILQILFNLVNNAIKYTPTKGIVEVSSTKKNSKVIFYVKDNGIGINKKYHKKIFEKFVQLGSEKNSNGLGLTITNALVKLHNGTITVESTPQKGSKFIVALPL